MKRFDKSDFLILIWSLLMGVVIVWAVVQIFFAFAVGDNGDWRISR